MYGQGLVTCLNKSDIAQLQEAIATPLESLSTPTAGLFPEFEQLEAFAGNQLEDDFHTILTRHGPSLQACVFFCSFLLPLQAAGFSTVGLNMTRTSTHVFTSPAELEHSCMCTVSAGSGQRLVWTVRTCFANRSLSSRQPGYFPRWTGFHCRYGMPILENTLHKTHIM